MARFTCGVCGSLWEQTVDHLFICETCGFAQIPPHVIEIESQEIERLWQMVNVALSDILLLSGPKPVIFRTTRSRELIEHMDLFPILYDRVVIPEIWGALDKADSKIRNRFLRYVAEGYLVPMVTDPNPMTGVFKMRRGDSFKPGSDFYERIYETGNFIELPLEVKEENLRPQFFIGLDNLSSLLTSIDIDSGRIDVDLTFEAFVKEGGLDNVPLTRSLPLFFVNKYLILSQLLGGFPLVMNPAYQTLLSLKFGEGFQPSASKQLSVLSKFLSQQRILIPTADHVISFRESTAGQQFRTAFSLILNSSYNMDTTTAVDELTERYTQTLQAFNSEAAKLGDTQIVIITGAIGTIAGLLGGVTGAVLGGAGTAAASIGARLLYTKMYERRHSSWAFLFHKWKQSSK